MKQFNFTTNSRVDYIITAVDTSKAAPASEGNYLQKNKQIEFPKPPRWTRNFGAVMLLYCLIFDAEAVAGMLKARNESNSLKTHFEERPPQLPAEPAVRIDSLLSFYHQRGQFNGTGADKIQARVLSSSKSYGYANKEKQLKADSNTQYRIGSLSKPFTAIVILQLAKEGKLSLKDPVRKFLPDYVNGDVSIEQLLERTSRAFPIIPPTTNIFRRSCISLFH